MADTGRRQSGAGLYGETAARASRRDNLDLANEGLSGYAGCASAGETPASDPTA